jgi:CRISPR-associated protein Cmr2
LLPTRQVLECAKNLRDTFRQDWARDKDGTERLLMGQKATISAGVAIVHYKEDLRFALQAARSAEDAAKQAGKNALQISACRRSGEHSSAWCAWEYVDTLCELVEAFLPGPAKEPGASDRWAYNLRRESATLEVLPDSAKCAEIMRLVNRSEQDTRQRLSKTNDLTAGAQIANAFKTYAAQRTAKRTVKELSASDDDRREAFRDFVILCQTASFLARGRDE